MNKYSEIEYQIRNIVWLIMDNDWKSFNVIIRFCSSNYGGIYFPIITLDENENISVTDAQYIYEYDPDFIILPKNFDKEIKYSFRVFDYIPWQKKQFILNRDLNGKSSICNYSPNIPLNENNKINILSTQHEGYKDESLFSLIYFGDVNHAEPMWETWDNEVNLYSWGHEVSIAREMLKDNVKKIEAGAYYNGEKIIPAPDRSKLNDIIKDEFKFPFGDFKKQLEIIADAWDFIYGGYLQKTISSNSKQNGRNWVLQKEIPAATIFISRIFNFKVAVNLWNSRVNGHNPFWFNIDFFIKHLDLFIEWIDSDSGGQYLAFSHNRKSIIRLISDESELSEILKNINEQRKKDWPTIDSGAYKLHYIGKNILKKQKTMLIDNKSEIDFFSDPNLPKNSIGTYTARITDNEYRLPFYFNDIDVLSPSNFPIDGILTKDRRIDSSGFIVTQVSNPQTIRITYPNKDIILDSILKDNKLKKEYTTTAKYQQEVISLFGGIQNFSNIFYNKKNLKFFNSLLDLSIKRSVQGWIIKNPFKMRILSYSDLLSLLISYESDIEKKDFLNQMIENEIVEYGLFCKCKYCDYSGFYFLDNIGKSYDCTRCRKKNYLLNQTEIKYKINPIIRVAIGENNIDVPLAALATLTVKYTKNNIIWYFDIDVIEGKKKRNIDITCFIDGLLFFGEAKINDEIGNDQFDFYKKLLKLNFVSGIIFATKCKEWKKGTMEKILLLKKMGKKIIILTINDLIVRY